jgi:hypothetical protein
MSQMDVDGTSLSVRPDVAATKRIKDNVGTLTGDDSCKEVPQSIENNMMRNYIN